MSDLGMKQAQELGLTDDDLDAAFARTMVRRNQLVRERSRRVGVVSGLAALALVVGAVVFVGSRDDAATGVGSDETGPTTTVAPMAALTSATPAGFSLTTSGGVSELTNSATESVVPDPDGDGGTGIDSPATVERGIDIVDWRVVPDGRGVAVQFSCLRNDADRITNVRYALVGATLTVEATVVSGYPGDECADAVGRSIVLPLPAGTTVPAHLRVVPGLLPGG